MRKLSCWTDAFVWNWQIFVELTHLCWTDAFARNCVILAAEMELTLFVELACWTDGCVELRISYFLRFLFLKNSFVIVTSVNLFFPVTLIYH